MGQKTRAEAVATTRTGPGQESDSSGGSLVGNPVIPVVLLAAEELPAEREERPSLPRSRPLDGWGRWLAVPAKRFSNLRRKVAIAVLAGAEDVVIGLFGDLLETRVVVQPVEDVLEI